MAVCAPLHETMPNPNIVWGESNMSVPKDVLFRPLGALAAHERYAEQMGGIQFEVTPVKGSDFYNRLIAGANSPEPPPSPPIHMYDKVHLFDLFGSPGAQLADDRYRFNELILSFHGSIRDKGDKSIPGRFFPFGDDALKQIKQAQGFLRGAARPVVLAHNLKDGNIKYTDDNPPSKDRSFQLRPSVFRDWGLDENASIQQIQAKMEEHGYHSITLDTYHVRHKEEDGAKFENPLLLTERLALSGLIKAIHLSVNRTDMLGLRTALNPFSKAARAARASKKAFMQNVDAALETDDGKLLAAVATAWNTNELYQNAGPLRIILEDGPVRLGGLGRIRRQHRKIFGTAKKLVTQSVLRPQPATA